MKQILKYILLTGLIACISIMLISCSKNKKDKDDILTDLEAAGFKNEIANTFKNLSDLTGQSSHDISLEISEVTETEDSNIYNCSVLCSSADYEITHELEVVYTKANELTYSEYRIINTDSLMKKKISDERITEDINEYFKNSSQTVEIDKKNIIQEMPEDDIRCEVTAQVMVNDGILSKNCTVNLTYAFSGKWNTYIEHTTDSHSWDISALAGKKWVDSSENGKGDFIFIESCDETSSSVNMSYKKGDKASSTPALCEYTTDEKTLKIKSEDISVEIYPDMSILMSGNKVQPENIDN